MQSLWWKFGEQKMPSHLELNHEEVTQPKCYFCDNTFLNSKIMKQHVNVIHGRHSNVKCNFCGKSYASMSDRLKQHKLDEHGEEGLAKHICHFCAKAFVALKFFNSHFEQFHLKVDYECLPCDKTFTSKKNYDIHMIQDHQD